MTITKLLPKNIRYNLNRNVKPKLLPCSTPDLHQWYIAQEVSDTIRYKAVHISGLSQSKPMPLSEAVLVPASVYNILSVKAATELPEGIQWSNNTRAKSMGTDNPYRVDVKLFNKKTTCGYYSNLADAASDYAEIKRANLVHALISCVAKGEIQANTAKRLILAQ